MMRQYAELRATVPDALLFYRMGDFFELFFEDARVAADALGIALTHRGEHGGQPVPMCGVPVHSADGYLARLVRAGHRVAIAEQTETPDEARARRGSKATVNRAIVRVVTAGTLTEDSLLDPHAANWLVAVARVGGRWGVAAADVSTGALRLTDLAEDPGAEIARLVPAEVLAAEGTVLDGLDVRERPPAAFRAASGEAALKRLFGVATLDGFGAFDRPALAAAAGLIDYLEHTGQGALPTLRPPTATAPATYLAIDAATRASLEITQDAEGGRAHSLLAAVDRTVTAAGARLLADDLSAPLTDRAAIEARLEAVEWMRGAEREAERLRAELKRLPDLARLVGKLAAGRATPRDLGAVRDGLGGARALHEWLAWQDTPGLVTDLLPRLSGHGELTDRLTRALVPEPPHDAAGGGAIAEGYDAALDELRRLGKEGRRAIAALEARYRDATGVPTLKVRHNGVLGYHLEVPARAADPLMRADSPFVHRQTMANAVRFSHPDLHEQAGRVTEAAARALAAEAAHLEELTELASARLPAIGDTADALARLDVAAALGTLARTGSWVRPELVDEPVFHVEHGRHPVVEAATARAGEPFVANDLTLTPDDRLWLVSGPNMGGKSTFLRQNALLVVLAQAGAFVPARAMRLGLVDRLFSRVGASDNLARGRSTFMVEMVETAAILAQATERSFVILDEIGRGTSTYDGLAIAWAVAEHVADTNRCRALFATHYHELSRLAETLDAVSLHHLSAREWKGDLVLLHEVASGPADRSYGLAVGKLAGLPGLVLARAKAVLAKLEAGRAATGGLAASLSDLPLFAAAPPEPEVDALREALAELDVEALSPREALEAVYRLKEVAGED